MHGFAVSLCPRSLCPREKKILSSPRCKQTRSRLNTYECLSYQRLPLRDENRRDEARKVKNLAGTALRLFRPTVPTVPAYDRSAL